MKKTTVSLKENQSSTVFNVFTITNRGAGFMSYESVPAFPFDDADNHVSPKQSNEIHIHIQLEGFGILSDEVLCSDSDSDSDQSASFVLWQDYKITFKGLTGYTDAEVDFIIEEIPKGSSKNVQKGIKETVTEFNKKSVTAILTYNTPVTLFDAFSITLEGVRSDHFNEAQDAPGVSRERVKLRLDGFGVSKHESIIINNKPDVLIQPLIWQGYKISYLSQNPKDVRLLVEEIPEEQLL